MHLIWSFFLKIFNIFSIKIYFSKPIHSKIVIYDQNNSKYLIQRLSRLEKVFVFDNRYRSINIYVFFYTLIKFGPLNLKKNYKKSFFLFLSPKFIITFSDTNPAFFLLKRDLNLNRVILICIQSSHRTDLNFLKLRVENK